MRKEEGKLRMGEKKTTHTRMCGVGMVTVLVMSTWLQHQPQKNITGTKWPCNGNDCFISLRLEIIWYDFVFCMLVFGLE